MSGIVETFIKNTKGEKLFFTHAIPPGKVVAKIGFIHGLGEHIGRYKHVFDFFNSKGIACFGFDSFGHGKSDGKRGHIRSMQQWHKEIALLLDWIEKDENNVPIILYGHSLGGNKLLNYLIANSTLPNLAIVTSPFIQEASPSPKIKVAVGRFLSNLFPSLTIPNDLPKNKLSHNNEVNTLYNNDPLVHNKISLLMGKTALESGDMVNDYSKGLQIPTLLVHGNLDELTSFVATKAFAKRNANSTFKEWSGLWHETHNETNWQEVLTYNYNWIMEQLNTNV